MRSIAHHASLQKTTPVYITIGLMAVAAATLATGVASHDLPLVTVSIVGTVLAGVALAWTCLLNTANGPDRMWQTSPAPSEGTGQPAANDFPIEDYDDLRVDEILPLLQELDAPELKMVQLREQLGPGRRAVLAHVQGLLELHDDEQAKPRFPIDGYDQLRVVDILPLLKALTPTELDIIACHELHTAERRTILSRIAGIQQRQRRLSETNHPDTFNP